MIKFPFNISEYCVEFIILLFFFALCKSLFVETRAIIIILFTLYKGNNYFSIFQRLLVAVQII
jgi:hypothetical protein